MMGNEARALRIKNPAAQGGHAAGPLIPGAQGGALTRLGRQGGCGLNSN